MSEHGSASLVPPAGVPPAGAACFAREGQAGPAREKEQMVRTARALARRSWTLLRSGRRRRASPLFLQCAHEATELLEAAVDFLRASPLDGSRAAVAVREPARAAPPRKVAKAAPAAKSAPSAPAAPAAAPPAGELMGRCAAVSVNELLGFLGMLRKSGRLVIGAAGEAFTVVLEDGFVVHAASDGAPPELRIGSILVRQGAIGQEQLDHFLVSYTRADGPLGVALEKKGLVSRQRLVAALEEQIGQLFGRLHNVAEATFAFQEDQGASAVNRVKLGVVELQLKSLKALDEERRDRRAPA